MKNKKTTVILAVATVIWLAFIFSQSAMSGEASSSESSFVMRLVTPILEVFTGKGGVTEHFVRKLAHFTEFAVLGALFESIIQTKNKSSFVFQTYVFFASVTTAVADETIQLFSSGRGSDVGDVLLDSSGALFGILLLLAVFKVVKTIKKRR